MIVRGFAAHQGDEASELLGNRVLSGIRASVHDKARRQIATQQAVVRGSDGEVSAQQIEPLVRARIFADREVERRAIV